MRNKLMKPMEREHLLPLFIYHYTAYSSPQTGRYHRSRRVLDPAWGSAAPRRPMGGGLRPAGLPRAPRGTACVSSTMLLC